MAINNILVVIRNYCLRSSFHGIKFLAEKHYHWTERIFWLICVTLSWYACAKLMKASYEIYRSDPISFGAETTYLDWDTKFPTIAVCETENPDGIATFTDKIYGDPHDYNLDEVIKELAYFRGTLYYTIRLCIGIDVHPDCPKNNFSYFATEVRSKCASTFNKCKWNFIEFDCCEYFLPIETEIGVCYAINTIQSKFSDLKKYPLISNRKLKPGNLFLELKIIANVYMLNEEEVPSLNTLPSDFFSVEPNTHIRRHIGIQEIENEHHVRDVAIEKRNCRYTDENFLNSYKYYSYSACIVQCRKDAQLHLCNCTHHLMPNTDPNMHCEINGLNCISKNYNKLAIIKPIWANRTGLHCDCLPSCTEAELFVIKDDKLSSNGHPIVEFILSHLPIERYKRSVVRGKLDLVVSMGGTVALFVGASLLSFIEIVYFII